MKENVFTSLSKPYEIEPDHEMTCIEPASKERENYSHNRKLFERWLVYERRRSLRTPAAGTIRYSIVSCSGVIEKSGLEARMIDLSDSGMGILTDYPLEPGCIIWFDDERGCNAGIARWRTEFKLHNTYRVGIQFIL